MATYTWFRQQSWFFSQSGWQLLTSLVSGQTLTRIRFDWSGSCSAESYTDLYSAKGEMIMFGLCTTIGDGNETPPLPADDGADQDPPAQRWIWWEGRSTYIDAYSQSSSGTSSLATKAPGEIPDAKAQVRAPDMPAGQALNVWATMETDASWPSQVTPYVQFWTSVLVRTP